MIVYCNFDAMVLTKKSNESRTEKGKFFYKIGVIRDDELGELNCTEEAYNAVEKGKQFRLSCAFNTQYNSFSVQSAESIEALIEAQKAKAAKGAQS